LQSDAKARGHERAVALERLKDATAHGSAADDSKFDLLHK
jgi:hypothetical protein